MLRITVRWDMKLTDREILKTISQLTTPVSQIDIASRLRCSERTVVRSVNRLRAAGYLDVVGGGNRFDGPYQYHINLEALPDDIRAELE